MNQPSSGGKPAYGKLRFGPVTKTLVKCYFYSFVMCRLLSNDGICTCDSILGAFIHVEMIINALFCAKNLNSQC